VVVVKQQGHAVGEEQIIAREQRSLVTSQVALRRRIALLITAPKHSGVGVLRLFDGKIGAEAVDAEGIAEILTRHQPVYS
jgi:hypothetical protein